MSLTDTAARTAKPRAKPYKLRDAEGPLSIEPLALEVPIQRHGEETLDRTLPRGFSRDSARATARCAISPRERRRSGRVQKTGQKSGQRRRCQYLRGHCARVVLEIFQGLGRKP